MTGFVVLLFFAFLVCFIYSIVASKHAYDAFIAESADDMKGPEMKLFWRRVKNAHTKDQRRLIQLRQDPYVYWHRVSILLLSCGLVFLVAGVVLLCL